MTITPELLNELKEDMHITNSGEDKNLKRLLSSSYSAIKNDCGVFNITDNERGKELVFNRVRYVYNDALEYFSDNFQSEITSFSLSLISGVTTNATV